MDQKFEARIMWKHSDMTEVTNIIDNGFCQFLTPFYVQKYNQACEVLNGCYEAWNAAFDELKDGSYEQYICRKQNEALKELNETGIVKIVAEILAGEESPELTAHVKFADTSFIGFIRIKPV